MSDNIVELRPPNNDAMLLGEATFALNTAMENFMNVDHPLGEVLFHMVHSIFVYIENLLDENEGGAGPNPLPKPSWKHINIEGDE